MDELSELQQWVDRETVSEGHLSKELVQRFQATLELDAFDENALPLGIHWCVGLDSVKTSALGSDGHPPKGGFLPPVPYPRRMWASGALEIMAPLRAGQALQRRSRIVSVAPKSGKSGNLCFVVVEHALAADGLPAIRETQTIVYREAGAVGTVPELPPDGSVEDTTGGRTLLPTAALLFRYSALTFNSHRIHYDLPYARGEEGYPGLVVHGPLQATLLADHAAQRLGRPLTQFSFRGQGPAFAGISLRLRVLPGADAASDGLALVSEQFGKTCITAEAA